MTFSTEQRLRPELGRGERLLWSGGPKQGLFFRPSDIVMVPFSLLWAGFAFFWEYAVSQIRGTPIIVLLWGVPFMLIGLYMVAGRFLVEAQLRRRACYGLTDQRVLILGGLFNRQVKSLPLASLGEITISERADRRGTIMFGPSTLGTAMVRGASWPGMGRSGPPVFDLIDDARRVYRLIRETQQSVLSATAARAEPDRIA